MSADDAHPLARAPQTYTDLAHDNLMLLAALWRQVWVWSNPSRVWVCMNCDAHGPDKATVKHAPGCALFGQDRGLLAQLDAFDAMPEIV